MTSAGSLLTIAQFAHRASRGQFVVPPHVQLWDQALMRVMTGECRRLIIEGPIRHGKSEISCKYMPPFYLGTHPGKRVFMLGHNDKFATDWGRYAYDIMDEHGWEYFKTRTSRDKTAASDWETENGGSMVSRGIGGSVMGKGADLIIMDDLFKDADEAESENEQERIWRWWKGTVYGRQEPGCAIVVINARWNDNDFVGRLKQEMEEGGEHWDVLTLSARCDDPETDPIGRALGEALWPERFDEAELAVKEAAEPYIFAAQWQANPTVRKGGIWEKDWAKDKILDEWPDPEQFEWCRYWDQAASADKGDWCVGSLVGLQKLRYASRLSRSVVIADIVRGRWGPGEVDLQIKHTAKEDAARRIGHVRIRGEQEGGSAGKKEKHAFVNMLHGYDVAVERNTGKKVVRARPLASQSRIGNVYLVKARWNNTLINEFCAFPKGRHDDIVDACSGGYNELVTSTSVSRGESPTKGHRGRIAR